MHNHAPTDYICPLCLAAEGVENKQTMVRQADIFYRDELVMALINSKFVGNNPGHAIVIPLKHFENVYELPEVEANRVMKVTQATARAMKAVRNCDGVMVVQNNEPASGQHAFHYHMHIFPRFEGDDFENQQKNVRVSDPAERVPYAQALREYFGKV